MKIIGYCRVSDSEDNGHSYQDQERSIFDVATHYQFDQPSMIIDKCNSAAVPILDRPAAPVFRNLGQGDIVIVATIDRLFSSSQSAQEMLVVWQEAGIRLFVAGMGEVTAENLDQF